MYPLSIKMVQSILWIVYAPFGAIDKKSDEVEKANLWCSSNRYVEDDMPLI